MKAFSWFAFGFLLGVLATGPLFVALACTVSGELDRNHRNTRTGFCPRCGLRLDAPAPCGQVAHPSNN